MAFIGIDLGTTYCVAAYIDSSGVAQVIPNERGQPITPSVVDIGRTPPIAGDDAKDGQRIGDTNVYAFFKRNMGDTNAIFMSDDHVYTPVDLSSILLQHIKEYAEAHLNEPVTDAVITVPAYFNDDQRRATKEAANKAGIRVLRIINEPTAAALAYGIRPNVQANGQKYLIYDLGGGTFDVTIAQIDEDSIQVIGSDGDDQLGGKDWDDAILNYLASQFEEEFGVELYGDDFNALLVQAEDTKRALSTTSQKEVIIQGQGHTGRYLVTRQLFENITEALLERTALLIRKALDDCRPSLSPSDIHGIVLVGGSTRMPMVKTFLTNLIGKPPLGGIHPDQAVALGAAIQAAMDMEAKAEASAQPVLLIGRRQIKDITTHSLGMIAENSDRSAYINSIILPKNMEIPSTQTRPYTLRVNRRGETVMEAYMTQGELSDPEQCVYLGKYTFDNIPDTGQKQVVVDVTYGYNSSGIVEVSAIERTTKQALSVSIERPPLEGVPERFLEVPKSASQQADHIIVYLAFDMSGSMSGQPLREAQKAAEGFLHQLDLTDASMGIIEFSDRVNITLKASQDAKKISKAIHGLVCGSTGYGNDDDPFEEAHKILNNAKSKKQDIRRYIVVLADGVWYNQSLAEQRAKRCHKDGINVIAIGFGGADEAFLKRISSTEELGFFVSMNSLVDTFSSIAQELTEGGGEINPQSLKNRRGIGLT